MPLKQILNRLKRDFNVLLWLITAKWTYMWSINGCLNWAESNRSRHQFSLQMTVETPEVFVRLPAEGAAVLNPSNTSENLEGQSEAE